jgi:glycosyltransferase involved in cell wall biosynthesis
MKLSSENQSVGPHLVWIFPGRLDSCLNGATWLKTTYELRQIGWQVTLINSGEGGLKFVHGVEVFCIFSPEIYFLRQVIFHTKLFFFLLARQQSIQIILFNQPSAPWIFPLKLLRQLRRSKTPLFVMDTQTVPMENLWKASLRDRLRGWFHILTNQFGNSWVDGQTANTRRMAERIHINPDHFWGSWPNGADLKQLAPALKIRKWPSKNGPIHVTYIGALHYERNLMSLCQAVEMANTEGMNYILTLTGDGSQRKELEMVAQRSRGCIKVNPPVPHEKVLELLKEVHIGALPFPDEEKYRVSSPIKLFEYMAAGLPILATRIVCHTDVIKNDTFVFWAEEASPEGLLKSLRNIWKERSNLKNMGEESNKFAQMYSWTESAKKLSDALQIGLQTVSPDFQSHFIQQNPNS